jgi:predicted transcriptional regulator
VSKLRFDLAQEGLLHVFKPYQVEVMRFLWETQTPQDSRAVYNHIKKAGVEGAKSRAAIINYLNHMVEEGFLDFEEKSTKGGIKRVYRLKEDCVDERSFRDVLYSRFFGKLFHFKRMLD